MDNINISINDIKSYTYTYETAQCMLSVYKINKSTDLLLEIMESCDNLTNHYYQEDTIDYKEICKKRDELFKTLITLNELRTFCQDKIKEADFDLYLEK